MNLSRKQIYWAAIILIVLTGLYPPWVHTFNAGSRGQSEKAGGYAWIFNPPAVKPDRLFGVKIDITRLLVQWVLICLLARGLVFTTPERSQSDRTTDSGSRTPERSNSGSDPVTDGHDVAENSPADQGGELEPGRSGWVWIAMAWMGYLALIPMAAWFGSEWVAQIVGVLLLIVVLTILASRTPYRWFRRCLTCGIWVFAVVMPSLGGLIAVSLFSTAPAEAAGLIGQFVGAGMLSSLSLWALRRGSDATSEGREIPVWTWFLSGLLALAAVRWGLRHRKALVPAQGNGEILVGRRGVLFAVIGLALAGVAVAGAYRVGYRVGFDDSGAVERGSCSTQVRDLRVVWQQRWSQREEQVRQRAEQSERSCGDREDEWQKAWDEREREWQEQWYERASGRRAK